jgi:hypothetical protein
MKNKIKSAIGIAALTLAMVSFNAAAQTTNLLTSVTSYFTSFNPAFGWTNVAYEFDTGYKQVIGQPAANALDVQRDFANGLDVGAEIEFDGVGSAVNSVEPEFGYAIFQHLDTKIDARLGAGYDFNFRAFKLEPNVTLKKKLTDNTYGFTRISFPFYAGSAFSRNPSIEVGVGGTF